MRRRAVFILVTLLCLAWAGWLEADDRAQTATVGALGGIAQNFANWVAQGLLWGSSIILLTLWVGLTWTVLKLYAVIGDYILPVWDVSSARSSGFLGSPLPDFMGIDPGWAHRVTQLGSVFFVIAATLVFLVVVADLLKATLGNEDASRAFLGFGYAFVAMILFPFLYTGIILLANEMTLLVHNYTVDPANGFPDNAASIFSALTKASIFGTMDPATQARLQLGNGGGLGGVSLAAGANMPSLDSLWALLFNPSGNAWNTAGQYVTGSIELFISRLIQIILCVMALVEIIALLLLKGAQVAGMILNYYLGIIACSMLASPRTRPIFFHWLKAFIELCFWGFLWSLLFIATWLIVGVASSLQGFDGTLVGSFLFPMLLFGTLKKFREVAGILSAFAVTGAIATGVGRSLESGFRRHTEVAGNAAASAVRAGGHWGSAALGAVADKASFAAIGLPGVGPALALGIQSGAVLGQALHSTGSQAVDKGLSGLSQPKGQGAIDLLKGGTRWSLETAADPAKRINAGADHMAEVYEGVANKLEEQGAQWNQRYYGGP
jgi:hypothetical protein